MAPELDVVSLSISRVLRKLAFNVTNSFIISNSKKLARGGVGKFGKKAAAVVCKKQAIAVAKKRFVF